MHTDWIKPGRAVWNYLDGTDPTVEGQKEMARLASQLGFEYNVIEGFWRNWPEAQLKDVWWITPASGA
jgi:alpha-glucosidase